MLHRLYAAFVCVIIVAGVAVSPADRPRALAVATAAAASPSPVPLVRFSPPVYGEKAVYVFGMGSTPATQGKLIFELVNRLKNYKLLNLDWLIPEPDWKPADFAQQCANDQAGTEGALIVAAISTANGATDRVFSRTTYTELTSEVLYAKCFSKQPAFTWQSAIQDETGDKDLSIPSLINAFSGLIALGSAYMTFVPSKTKSVQTYTAFSTPNPPPPQGATTQTIVNDTSAFNATGLAGVSGSLLSNSLAYVNAVTTLQGSGDEMVSAAARKIMDKIVPAMHCPLLDPSPGVIPGPTPSPAPFCWHDKPHSG